MVSDLVSLVGGEIMMDSTDEYDLLPACSFCALEIVEDIVLPKYDPIGHFLLHT